MTKHVGVPCVFSYEKLNLCRNSAGVHKQVFLSFNSIRFPQGTSVFWQRNIWTDNWRAHLNFKGNHAGFENQHFLFTNVFVQSNVAFCSGNSTCFIHECFEGSAFVQGNAASCWGNCTFFFMVPCWQMLVWTKWVSLKRIFDFKGNYAGFKKQQFSWTSVFFQSNVAFYLGSGSCGKWCMLERKCNYSRKYCIVMRERHAIKPPSGVPPATMEKGYPANQQPLHWPSKNMAFVKTLAHAFNTLFV